MEKTETDTNLQNFYRCILVPLADLAQKQGVEFFPAAPEPSADTYYSDRVSNDQYLHQIDLSDLEGELRELWEQSEFPELASIAGQLAKFATLLNEKEETTDEVSPFIYAMF